MKKHPCKECINNWSGEPIGCSDYCEQLNSWNKVQENKKIIAELKRMNDSKPPLDLLTFEHLSQHDNY